MCAGTQVYTNYINYIYVYVRSNTKTKERIGLSTDQNHNTMTDIGLAANMMNDYFSTVPTQNKISRKAWNMNIKTLILL